jgi:AefR-like transcriptional repressor, C-terminal domain
MRQKLRRDRDADAAMLAYRTGLSAALCKGWLVATILKPLLFNAADPPSEERINHVVGIAVRTFLAAYRRAA